MRGATTAVVEQAASVVLEQAGPGQQADLLTILGIFGEPLLATERFVRMVGRERLMSSDLINYLVRERIEELERAHAIRLEQERAAREQERDTNQAARVYPDSGARPLPRLGLRRCYHRCGILNRWRHGQDHVGEGRSMNDNRDDVHVANNEAAQRYEARVDGELAVITYQRAGDRIVFLHTEVPEDLEGHGIAGTMARVALDEARAQHLEVIPRCPFVAAYIRRHPEYADLVPPDARARLLARES